MWLQAFEWRRLIPCLFAIGLVACLQSCNARTSAELDLVKSVPDLTINDSTPIDIPLPDSPNPLVIEVRGNGVNFASQIQTADGRFLSEIHFNYLRSVPHYHHIDPAVDDRPLMLRLQPLQGNPAATLSVRFLAVPESARLLDEAWRDFANGQQKVATMDRSEWTSRLVDLQKSQKEFEILGASEPALWTAYLTAYFQYFPLYNYTDAYQGATHLLKKIEASRNRKAPIDSLDTLTVLGHQLAGQVLLESDGGLAHGTGKAATLEARTHFRTARDLADSTGLAFESTWAINNTGIAHFYESQLQPALDQYTVALAQARSQGDRHLTNLIGSNVAVALQKLGHIEEAVSTLEGIQQQNPAQQNLLEQEYILSLLGSYYLKLYRFPEALNALNQALQLSEALKSSESRGRNNVMLGRVYREMGQADKARAFATLSLADLREVNDQRGQRHAHRLLADVARLQGDFKEMRKHRQLEQQLLLSDADRASWMFSMAEDLEAQGLLLEASKQFQQSAEAYQASGFPSWANLATLNACSAAISRPPAPECTIGELAPVVEATQQFQASAPAMQARFTWIRLLDARGHAAEALPLAGQLVTDIQFYRFSLPGVLGAWYWDARERIFSYYLNLILETGSTPDGVGTEALLALDRLRNSKSWSAANPRSQAPEPPAVTTRYEANKTLRELLARRDEHNSATGLIEIQRQIDTELGNTKSRLPHRPVMVSDTDVERFRRELADLPEDWSLLNYYIGGRSALAWVGTRKGLTLFELGPSAPILQRLESVKTRLRVYNEPSLDDDLAALGELLLRPLLHELNFNVMVAGGGALADLPLETLFIDGQEFIQTHQVINIHSVSGISRVASHASAPLSPGRLFLGGYTPNPAGDFAALPGSGQELHAIRSAFANSDVDIHAPRNLDIHQFRSVDFQGADLIHLASHALIDRDYPELSRLVLSGVSPGDPEFLMPADLQGLSLSARLIVLSACETAGLNRFDFDSQLGFVTQLLDQSGATVVASLWPVSDRDTSQLMSGFYASLAAGSNAATALRLAKLEQLARSGSTNRNWAAFQVFDR